MTTEPHLTPNWLRAFNECVGDNNFDTPEGRTNIDRALLGRLEEFRDLTLRAHYEHFFREKRRACIIASDRVVFGRSSYDTFEESSEKDGWGDV